MFKKFIEYMNSDAVVISQTDYNGEEVFNFSMSNWAAWGIVILLGIVIFV